MTATSSQSSDKGLGMGLLFGAATILSAAGMVTFGVEALTAEGHGAQHAGAFAFAAATIFAMLSIVAIQWYEA
ncbi:DUF7525 family protein [Haloarchaeobius sp. TZWWS8]|uniref:DUF7525 family protein n=1 Tax=Haloarchaeobius sp. TZWWS8 TaxID=3446121 RepID=UPI003EBD7830